MRGRYWRGDERFRVCAIFFCGMVQRERSWISQIGLVVPKIHDGSFCAEIEGREQAWFRQQQGMSRCNSERSLSHFVLYGGWSPRQSNKKLHVGTLKHWRRNETSTILLGLWIGESESVGGAHTRGRSSLHNYKTD